MLFRSLRKTEKPEETLLVICNFAAVPHENYQVGVPFAGKYKEIFNSDAAEFGGEGVVNARAKSAKAEEFDEREHSIKVKLPALGVSIFSCTPGKTPAKKKVTAAKAVKTTKDKNAGKLVKAARTKVAKKVEAATEKAAKKTEIVEKKAATKKPVKEEKSAKAEEAVKAEKKEKEIGRASCRERV